MLEGTAETRVRAAVAAIREGRMVILTDDEDRENEGDLVLAAERGDAGAINFMAKHARGLICLTLTEDHIRAAPPADDGGEEQGVIGTAFTVSVEAREGVTTGISAADRAHRAGRGGAQHEARRPRLAGAHLPTRARPGGVLQRTGQTEGSIDLAVLAGLQFVGGHLRDHERRRHHGAHAGAGGVLAHPRRRW